MGDAQAASTSNDPIRAEAHFEAQARDWLQLMLGREREREEAQARLVREASEDLDGRVTSATESRTAHSYVPIS